MMEGAASTPLAFDTLAAYEKNADIAVQLNAVLGLEQCKDPRAADACQTALKEPSLANRKKTVDQPMGINGSYSRLDARVKRSVPASPEMGNPRNPRPSATSCWR